MSTAQAKPSENGLGATASGPLLRAKEFRFFSDFVYRHAGIRFPDSKISLVQNRLRKRLASLELKNYAEYIEVLQTPGRDSEVHTCLNALTTNETFFFRHKSHWDFFGGTILPEWRRRHPQGGEMRLWSAAASNGSEAYSAAILLSEQMDSVTWSWTIDATDINDDVLEIAREGSFGEYSLQKATSLCIRKYFVKEGLRQRIAPALRAAVRFRRHNLLEKTHNGRYHVIFLRNVIIYFDEESKRRVLQNVIESLESGGYLFLGGAESLSCCQDRMDLMRATVYRKR